jgi:hypothetical protein
MRPPDAKRWERVRDVDKDVVMVVLIESTGPDGDIEAGASSSMDGRGEVRDCFRDRCE